MIRIRKSVTTKVSTLTIANNVKMNLFLILFLEL